MFGARLFVVHDSSVFDAVEPSKTFSERKENTIGNHENHMEGLDTLNLNIRISEKRVVHCILNEPGATPISYFFEMHCQIFLECSSRALWDFGTLPLWDFWTFELWDSWASGLLDFWTLGLWDLGTLGV